MSYSHFHILSNPHIYFETQVYGESHQNEVVDCHLCHSSDFIVVQVVRLTVC